MDLTTITVANFKTQFRRDFPYLPNYDPTIIYNIGVETYYATTNLFYSALQNGVVNVPPGSDVNKWAIFADTLDNYVQDQDITNAFADAQAILNQGIFSSDAQVTLAYLYLTAHYLVTSLRASASGINGGALFALQSRSVASVSETYQIPKAYTDDPILSMFTTSAYGMRFLSMALPGLVGNIVAVYGGTNP